MAAVNIASVKPRCDNVRCPSKRCTSSYDDDANEKRDEDLYLIHRASVEHEDENIFHRTNGLLSIQAFLLAAFGVGFFRLLAPELSSATRISISEIEGYLTAIICVGLLTSMASLISILAAANAIRELERHWWTYYVGDKQVYFDRHIIRRLPGLTGGGRPWARRLGIVFCLWIPVFFAMLWGIFLYLRICHAVQVTGGIQISFFSKI